MPGRGKRCRLSHRRILERRSAGRGPAEIDAQERKEPVVNAPHATQPPIDAHGTHACCASNAEPVNSPAASPHATHTHATGWRGAAAITLHCLTGCAIGELTGLAIGVSLAWPVNGTITLAVVLAFLCGFGLTLAPMLRRGLGFQDAF